MALKVLIVDDAGFVRQILSHLLSELGCDVVGEARNGVEAVDKARLAKPDLIFLDMVLPFKNGAEVAAEILETLPTTRVIAMSSATEDLVRTRADQAGCIRFLPKPFNREAVESILQSIDGWKKPAAAQVS